MRLRNESINKKQIDIGCQAARQFDMRVMITKIIKCIFCCDVWERSRGKGQIVTNDIAYLHYWHLQRDKNSRVN